MKTGIEIIAAERQRQIEKEGYLASHDDKWEIGELALAGACYAVANTPFYVADELTGDDAWPWGEDDYKPNIDRVLNLARAGALIAAEIDRLNRLSSTKPNIASTGHAPARPFGVDTSENQGEW